jgi:dsDNA-binding SOS-regulon protein
MAFAAIDKAAAYQEMLALAQQLKQLKQSSAASG